MAVTRWDLLLQERVFWEAEERGRASFVEPATLITATPCGYFLTTYGFCDMRCVYCATGAQGRSQPHLPADIVVERLRAELAHIPEWSPLGLGGAVDAYPEAEAQYGVTRLVVEELVRLGRIFTIVTKGPLVERDVDLLAGNELAEVQVSICSLDPRLQELEPGVVPAAERIALLRRLRAAGVQVSVSARPWIPGLSDAASLVAALPDDVPVTLGPLDVTMPEVPTRPFGRMWDQDEINEAYVEEFERVGTPDNVGWYRPTHLGRDPEVYEFLGRGPIYESWLKRHIVMSNRRLRTSA